MQEHTKKTLEVADILCHEYGWTLDYVLSLKSDLITGLVEIITDRKKTEAEYRSRLMALSVNAGFAGKLDVLDKVFKPEPEELTAEAWKSQLKAMWKKTGRDLNEFEEKWAKGEEIKL